MNDDKYLRTIKDLEKVGCKWWPKEVRDEAQKVIEFVVMMLYNKVK